MSFTNFTYSDLSIVGSAAGGTRQPNGPGQSLDPWLHDKVVNVTFTLTNAGAVGGTEVDTTRNLFFFVQSLMLSI